MKKNLSADVYEDISKSVNQSYGRAVYTKDDLSTIGVYMYIYVYTPYIFTHILFINHIYKISRIDNNTKIERNHYKLNNYGVFIYVFNICVKNLIKKSREIIQN
jgi:hypothetical protein